MNSSQQTANNTIDLHRLIMLCRKHIKMLIIWTLLAGILGYVVAQFVVVPKYTATTEILVNQKHESNDNGQAYNNQQADIQMINTSTDYVFDGTNKGEYEVDAPTNPRNVSRAVLNCHFIAV